MRYTPDVVIEPGLLIGDKYRLLRQVGHGGMASVWEAEHTTLGSSVAVKLVRTEGRDRDALVRRFLDEARAAAQVTHRHVVEILDFGQTDGQPYMVMELLRGTSLGAILRSDRPPPTKEVIELLMQALRGLAAVHDQGLIHRDLKPANIFVAQDADGAFVKLVDFGLSRTMGERSPLGDGVLLAGTPEYMSPEQARGATDLDKRTDVYSMGVILHQVLTGALPYDADSLEGLLAAIRRGEPDALGSDVPKALATVVERAMAFDRRDRYGSARELLDALIDVMPAIDALPTVGLIEPMPRSLHTQAMTMDATVDGVLEPTGLAQKPAPSSVEQARVEAGAVEARPEQALERVSLPSEGRPRLWWLGIAAVAAAVALWVMMTRTPEPRPVPSPPTVIEIRQPEQPARVEPDPPTTTEIEVPMVETPVEPEPTAMRRRPTRVREPNEPTDSDEPETEETMETEGLERDPGF